MTFRDFMELQHPVILTTEDVLELQREFQWVLEAELKHAHNQLRGDYLGNDGILRADP